MQSGAIQEFDPDIVLWYSSRERFSVLAAGVVKKPGSPEHRDQLEADLEAAYERLAAGGSAGAHRAADSLVDCRHRQVRRRSVGAP